MKEVVKFNKFKKTVFLRFMKTFFIMEGNQNNNASCTTRFKNLKPPGCLGPFLYPVQNVDL